MNLFNKKILNQRISNYSFPTAEKAEDISKLIIGWQKALKDSDLSKTKEKSIQGKFLSVFFEQILGYQDKTSGTDQWTLVAEPKTEVDAQTADGAIGFFSKSENLTVGAIELKDAKTSLDKKQKGREKGYSPVEQAYMYATKFDRCKWIIVSNFREIRLYNKARSEQFFEKFDVLELHKEEEFRKFYFLLSKENLISKEGESPIDDLVKKSEATEEDISKHFYTDYKSARQNLYNHLTELNSGIDKKVLFEKSQKILDRVVFILFCEDTANLLPKNILRDTYQLGVKSRDRSDEKVWREMKNLFIDIDEGRSDIDPKINGYNGGLFKYDEVLDTLVIKDGVWQTIIKLADYDFETDLNVNILGHIFEQSISDIESIKSEIEGEEQDKSKSKRKKDGIFYTPEYITKYIVENTVGKYLEEHPDKLSSIKILDPACGSGAFLNQAHSYLLNEYRVRHEQKMLEKHEKGEEMSLFDYNPAEANRAILLNNLYGVDLNDESVEITKLSLWLKTARKDEPLQNLDGNIKAGNSLIDSAEIAGEKAFDWNKQFDSIMGDGGFDVIIGNPPYGYRGIPTNEIKEFYKNTYKTYEGNFEFYRFLIERSMHLLKEGGFLSFIIPNTFLTSKTYSKLREFLLEYELVELIELGLDVFADVLVESTIFVVKKARPIDHKVFVGIDKIHPNLINFEEHYKVNQNDWVNNKDKVFSVYVDPKSEKILSKMSTASLNLSEIAICTVGINTGYIKADMVSNSKKDNRYHKALNGKDIGRYTIEWPGEWIIYDKEFVKSFGDKGRSLPPEEIFSKPKILIQRTRRGLKRKLVAYYDTEAYYNFNRISNVVINNNDFLTGYIAGILNSTLLDYYFNKKFAEYEVKPFHLSQLPIATADKETQEKIQSMVENIQASYKKLSKLLDEMTEFITTEIKSTKPFRLQSKHLEGWNTFSELLNSLNSEISISTKAELQSWFKTRQSEYVNLTNSIRELDKDIDSEVYSLYEITQEEVAVIENHK